jgi:chromosome segregation ATPase
MSKGYNKETYHAVISLLQTGKAPSWRAVRAITESGSSNDILRDIKVIMAELAERSSAGEYPKEAQDAFWALWMELKGIAGRELDAHREQMSAAALRAEAAAEEALSKTQQLQERLQERDEKIQALTLQLEQSSRREDQLAAQLEQSAVAIQVERDKQDELRLEHKEELKLRDQVARDLQANLQQEVAYRHQVIAEMVTEHQKKVDHQEQVIRNENERYNADTAKLMRALDAERTQWRKEQKELQVEAKMAAEALATARQKASVLESELSAVRARLDDTQQHLASQEKRNEALQAEHIAITTRLVALTDKLSAKAERDDSEQAQEGG